MGSEAENRQSFHIQARYAREMAAPIVARICTALADAVDRGTVTGQRVIEWPGEPVADALALRLQGGLHALHRTRADADLSAIYRGEITDPVAVRQVLHGVLARHDAALLPWLGGPPQTNEPGRSAGLMTGLLHLATRLGPRFELLEIGSSAGLNLLIDRFRFDLGGVAAGPGDAALAIVPQWRGPPPPATPVEITSVRGVDVAPVDVRDAAQAARLEAYCWIDAHERLARLETAIGLVRAHGVRLEQGDAADWIEARLGEPQEAGVTRVLMHSVVWQYIPPERRERIRVAMDAAGTRASAQRPLGWVMMEPNRDLHRHEVRVRGWPGERPMEMVALTHAHGAWVEGLAPPYETRDHVMWRGAYED
jgi:hypothetical protein